ncbi:MAG: 4-phosphoerythronate dehydrogenase [Muribaculaceae bacterium]|nr:4-phosphoerythronate dehydrogenase [Muribaculaceae bacterium]
MKIVVDSAIPFIKDRFPKEIEVLYRDGKSISADDVRDAQALIVRTRTKCDETLLGGSKVKLIATATIGKDHIDIPWCESKGIKVISSPGCNAPGVAQYVFSSLFKTGFNLDKDTLGIIGYGNVGSIVGEWAKKMGIKTLINDPPRENKGLADISYKSLEEVLKKSDAVTLHIPFTKYGEYPTYKLIGEKELGLMKPGSILINTSRGGVVEEKFLKDSLKQRNIKAIIDVWEKEPDIDFELLELSSISTPHIAGYSAEGKMRATRMVLEGIKDFFAMPVDLDGLECLPNSELEISRSLIELSYDPRKDSEKLKENPSQFENLRNEYYYRREPLFYNL